MTMGGVAPAERRGFLLFLVLLAALACACLGKALAGELFVSTETVYRHVQPWSGLEPAPPLVHNEDLADPPTVWLPMHWATRAMVRDWAAGGEPPLWQPQSYCGSPWLGNMSSALFSPFTWLFVLLPFGPAFALCAAAKWLLAGTGAWLLARRLGVSPAGRALAGMAFAFCGFQVVWINSCLTNVSVFAPWLLLAIERVVERPSGRSRGGRVVALALVSWQVLVGGHPETSLYVGLGAAVFASCRWLAAEEQRPRMAVALCAGAALGAALSVVQWWPFLEYALHSLGREQRLLQPDLFRVADRSGQLIAIAALALLFVLVRVGLRRDGGEDGGGVPASPQRIRLRWFSGAALVVIAGLALRDGGLRPALLMEIVPDWFGRSLDGGAYRGPLFYNDTAAGFCGGALFVLALATALVRAGDRRVLALALMLLVVAARWFRVPLIENVVEALPQVATTGATRALAMVALTVALLGGFALDELRERPRRLAIAAGGCLLFFAAFGMAREPYPSAIAGPASNASMLPDATGVGLDDLPNLADEGPTRLGAELSGRAPPGTERVRISVNGVVKAEVPTAPPLNDGRRPFHWRFTGSHRLESGGYEIAVDTLDERGVATRFDTKMARCERPPAPSLRWAVHLAAVGAVLLAAFYVGSARTRITLLLVATAIELCFFGADYNDTTPPSRVPAKVEPLALLEEKRRELGPFRVFTARNHVHPNLHLLFDLEVLRGYDALEPVNYIHTLDFLYRDGVVVPWTEMDLGTLDFAGYPGAQLADLMNVRYLLSEETAPAGYRETWRRGTLALYENPDRLPRAFTVQRGTNALRAWEQKSDLRTLAAWETDEEIYIPGTSRVLTLDHRRGCITATVESDSGTILIVSENFDGWQAILDGQPAPLRRTHGTFLSLVIPSGGRHSIELVYRPRSVVWGSALSAGALLPLLALLLFARRRSSDAEPVIL